MRGQLVAALNRLTGRQWLLLGISNCNAGYDLVSDTPPKPGTCECPPGTAFEEDEDE